MNVVFTSSIWDVQDQKTQCHPLDTSMPLDPSERNELRPVPAVSSGAPRAHCLLTSDFDEISGALQRWACDFSQLDEGEFIGGLRFADLKTVQVLDVQLNRSTLLRGGHPKRAYVFSPIEESNEGALWRGRKLRPGMLNARTADVEIDHRTCPRYRSADLVIDEDHLRACALSYLGVELDDLMPCSSAIVADNASTFRLAQLIRATLGDVESRRFASHQWSVDRLVTCVLELLGAGRRLPEVQTSSTRRKEIVRQVERIVIGDPTVPQSALQLAMTTGVSRRALDHAFLEVTGLPPKTYLKALRLNCARRELHQHRPERGIVGRIASRWGFLRPDHFAADFHQHFGELPSFSVGRKNVEMSALAGRRLVTESR
ncbi:helix-turn-helix transcriptional regulator [Caulifigura coniformis]|uniref:helix-turn-helix transcriptional regulator n=1 Tax=Caulifigura coniformis TaxID=2527983 RepID=UPI0018D24F56|nr:helix-turn-helix transcriptional regulator [Caulifigura coniformis]